MARRKFRAFKILAWITLSLFSLILLITVGFYLSRAWIMDRAVTYLNEQQPGEVQMGQMNLIPFMNFPDVSLQLRTVSFYEKSLHPDSLYQEPILSLNEIYVTLDVLDLIRGDIMVSEARLEDGFLRVEIYKDSLSNLENALGIRFGGENGTLADTVETGMPLMEINLDKIVLTNIMVVMNDRVRDDHVELMVKKLVSNFSYLSDRVDAGIEVSVDINKLKYLTYNEENKRSVAFKSSISVDPLQKVIEVRPSSLKISGLELETWGTFEYEGKPRVDLAFRARNEGLEVLNYIFRGVLDLDEIEQIGAGSINLNGNIRGILGEQLPVINVKGTADHIGFRIKSIQKDVTDISFNLNATNGSKLDFTEGLLQVEGFTATFPEGDIKANISVRNMVTPELNIELAGEIDLMGLEDMIHTEKLADLGGTVNIYAKIDGVVNRKTGEFLNEQGIVRASLTEVGFTIHRDSSTRDSVRHINGELLMKGDIITSRMLTLEYNGNKLDFGIFTENLLLYLMDFDTDVRAKLSVASEVLDPATLIRDTAMAGLLGGELHGLHFSAGALITSQELDSFLQKDLIPEVLFTLDSFGIEIPAFASISQVNASVTFGPDTISLQHLNGIIGESEFDFSGMVSNFGALGTQDSGEVISVGFDISSELMRAEDFFTLNNEFLLPETYITEYLEDFHLAGSLEMPVKGLFVDSLALDFGLELLDVGWNFRYYPLTFEDFNVQIRRNGDRLFIDNFQGNIGESNIKMSATLENFADTAIENLKGSLVVESDLLDFNRLLNYQLPEELEDKAGIDSMEVREPPRLDQISYPQVDFTVDIGELRFGENIIYGMKGKLRSSNDKIFYLDRLVTLGANGGNMEFSGQFNVSNPLMYTFSAELDLEKVDFRDLSIPMQSGDEIYTLNEKFEGVLTANGLAEVFITPDLKVDISNTTAIFNVTVTDGALINFTPLQAAGKSLGNKDLNYVRFSTLRNSFTLMDSRIIIPIMNVESTLGQLLIEGEQGLDNSYLYLLRVPPRLAMQAAKSSISNAEAEEGEDEIQEMKRGKFISMTVWSDGVESDFKLGDRREKFEE